MVFESSEFVKSVVCGYLRTLRRFGPRAVTGEFEHSAYPFIWGSCIEYGLPPYGSLVLELWRDEDPGRVMPLRVWNAVENPRTGKNVRGRSVQANDLGPAQVPSSGMA